MRLAILQVLLLSALASGLGVCDDPRTLELNRTCETPSYGLLIPSVHGNPYHALHDTLWAVSHYLRNCAKYPLTLHVPTLQDLRLCETPNADPQPDWGFCVAYALGKAAGAEVETEDSDPQTAGHRRRCHTKETVLRQSKVYGWPETFRGLNWFADYGDGHGHVRLDRRRAGDALRHIRSVVRRFYRVGRGGSGYTVNVLVYDRADTRRRKWVNAPDVVDALRRMAGVKITYVKNIPVGLGRQVKLFGESDVVVAPHGAAMSNSIFMREGSALVELKKECFDGSKGHRGTEWSGWHASLMGLTLRYMECERVDKIEHRVNAEVIRTAVADIVRGMRKRRLKEMARRKKRAILVISFVILALLVVVRTHMVFQKRVARRKLKGSGMSL